MSALAIRPATPSDAQQVHRIHTDSIRRLCAADYSAEQIDSWVRFRSVDDYRRAIASGEWNCVACLGQNGPVVGYATYVPGELTALFVDPAHARHGTGRSLLAEVERFARGQGLSELTLQSTLTSRAFYERHGYLATGTESYTLPDGITIRCVRMTRRI